MLMLILSFLIKIIQNKNKKSRKSKNMKTIIDEYGGVFVRLTLVSAGISALYLFFNMVVKLGL